MDYLEQELADFGYTAVSATHGQALEKAIVEKSDLILLDVMMPGLDGFAVCQLLKFARNSGSNAPPPFINDLPGVSDRSMMPMVVEKEPWLEPRTGETKVPGWPRLWWGRL